MTYFPINYSVAGRKVLVVGGGTIAYRKVMSLLECGARVTVVSPQFSAALSRAKGVRLRRRRYRKSDLRSACLVISATDIRDVNVRVAAQASAAGIPVNVVDQPDLCTFTLPAVVRKDDLLVTISTGGASPAMSRRIRELLKKVIGPEYARHLKLLKEMRPLVQATPLAAAERMALLKRMAGEDVSNVVARRGIAAGRRLLRDMLAAQVDSAAAGKT